MSNGKENLRPVINQTLLLMGVFVLALLTLVPTPKLRTAKAEVPPPQIKDIGPEQEAKFTLHGKPFTVRNLDRVGTYRVKLRYTNHTRKVPTRFILTPAGYTMTTKDMVLSANCLGSSKCFKGIFIEVAE